MERHLADGSLEPLEIGAESPLDTAVTDRDRDTLAMVHKAVADRNVVLAFQPVVQSSRPNSPIFYEGLVRVLDDRGRVIPARNFIATIETTELGRVIDCLSLEMGLMSLAEDRTLRLSINMSARSIGYQRWRQTLKKGLAADSSVAERLILEVTENSAMVVPDIMSVFMQEMQSQGVTFALDDFGAGFTSFRYLRQFYFDVIKIDSQFCKGIADNPDNQVLTAALLSIARHFDMFTVAEGVENGRDAAHLAEVGIDCMQGYYYGAPSIMPPWKTAPEQMRA